MTSTAEAEGNKWKGDLRSALSKDLGQVWPKSFYLVNYGQAVLIYYTFLLYFKRNMVILHKKRRLSKIIITKILSLFARIDSHPFLYKYSFLIRYFLNSESTQHSLFQCGMGIGIIVVWEKEIPLLCLFLYRTKIAKVAYFRYLKRTLLIAKSLSQP